MISLQGKSALITGGGRGIGAGIAKRLAEEGCDVAITFFKNSVAAADVVRIVESFGRKGTAIKADSGVHAEILSAVDDVASQFGKIDILVNNSGQMEPLNHHIENVDIDTISRNISVNLTSALLFAQAAIRIMPSGGRIINIGSCLSRRVPLSGVAIYSMTKAGLSGLTKGLARDFGPRGITVNEISPGPIDTDLNPADGPGASFWKGLTVRGHYGSVYDVAEAVCFLASGNAAFINGSNLAVDGGVNI